MRKPELLAPAGSMSMLRAAVDAGADAVYLGLNQYNARIHADNFTPESLCEALDYAHLRNARVYITLNTLLTDDEVMDAVELALDAFMKGADAFLVQDKGLASYLSSHFPQIPLHASTQMNVFSLDQADEMENLGMKRVVLPRELSLSEIKARAELFHERDIEVEVFVHGAMCVCYSGLCLFSSMNKSGSRSGNRGSCAQPCRQSYQIWEGERGIEVIGKPIRSGKLLSPKDQSALPYLRDLMSIGVDSLKIEGRMRDEQYCTAVVSAYRRMIDAIFENNDTDEVLKEVRNDLLITFNRGGDFTTQYMQGKKGPDYLSGEYAGKYGLYWGDIVGVNPKLGTINVRSFQKDVPQRGDFLSVRNKEEEVASFPIGKIDIDWDGAIVKGLHPDAISKLRNGMSVYRMSKKIEVPREKIRRTPISGTLTKEDSGYVLKVSVMGGMFDGVSASCTEMIQEPGDGEPLTWVRTEEQLRKTGQTPFRFAELKQDGDFPVFLRIAQINAMRRDAMAYLAEAVLAQQNAGRTRDYTDVPDEKPHSFKKPEKMHITIADYLDMRRITGGYACGADIYVFSALQILRSGRIRYIDELMEAEPEAKVALRLPGAYKDDMIESLDKAFSMLKTHAGKRFLGFFGTNINGLTIGLLAGANVFNRFGYRYESARDLQFLFPSYELSDEELRKLGTDIRADSFSTYMAVHRFGPIEWMQSEFCPLGRHQKHCSMCTEHPEVSMGEMGLDKSDLHHDHRVDIVCYPGFCRSDLFGDAKYLISGSTVQELLRQGIPIASTARFMNEDQEERRMIIESMFDQDSDEEDGEDWYEY
ncbi:MAG: U32 family peptidase [Clostridiales bacterium]|nr:U32 family peptidase [Clostridiales bacterium]